MKLKKEDFNWYGFDHENVAKRFNNDAKYIGTFTTKNDYVPQAVYRCENPDRSLGHKDYILLHKDPVLLTFTISGMDTVEMEQYRYQDGKGCEHCGEALYSVMQHDYRECACKRVMVDGGRAYMRCSQEGTPVVIDLLDGDVIRW